MDVGVRELKQQLSAYLRLVDDGTTIRITDRGQPKALLVPITSPDRLQVGIDEGWIRAPVSTRPIGERAPSSSERRVLDVLRDDRGE